ncbi:MAG: hypothetical protein QW589_06020 [Candidatus Bathyarchaeia archaeon]
MLAKGIVYKSKILYGEYTCGYVHCPGADHDRGVLDTSKCDTLIA